MGGIAKVTRNNEGNSIAPQVLLDGLATLWPDAECELDHRNAFELLIATILSAQSTDKRVNIVTKALFAAYPDAHALAEADPSVVEQLVHATGFYRQKTKNIIRTAQLLVAEHDGEIPKTVAALVKLPGVARKTANVVLGVSFGIPSGVVVDTHVKRLANRFGLTSSTDPKLIEQDLMERFPAESWIDLSHRLIWHGRRVCHARAPACETCGLAPHCPSRGI